MYLLGLQLVQETEKSWAPTRPNISSPKQLSKTLIRSRTKVKMGVCFQTKLEHGTTSQKKGRHITYRVMQAHIIATNLPQFPTARFML